MHFHVIDLLTSLTTNILLILKRSQSNIIHRRCSLRKGVLVKFTGKHLCQSLFFNIVVGLRTATLLKKKLWR